MPFGDGRKQVSKDAKAKLKPVISNVLSVDLRPQKNARDSNVHAAKHVPGADVCFIRRPVLGLLVVLKRAWPLAIPAL